MNKQASRKEVTFTVDFNTISGMEVTMFADSNIHECSTSFAKSFVEYMTNNALVSDEVLVSSIGASTCRKAMKEGFMARVDWSTKEAGAEQRVSANFDDDYMWRSYVLTARHGMRKYHTMQYGKESVAKIEKEFPHFFAS